jgi:outer membrane lipoprotein-sorting protein
VRTASLGFLALALLTLSAPPGRAATPVPRAAPSAAYAAAPAPLSPGTDARPLIVAAVAAPKHVSFVGQQLTIRSGTNRASAVLSKVEHRAPDETRRTYLTPRSLYGQYVVSRGAKSWDFDPERKRVVVTENKAAVDPVAVVDDIALVDANYRAVRSASDDVANRRTDVVDLVSRYTGERTMRLWIDQQTHVVLAKEAYHSDGSPAWRTRFDDIRYTEGIPQSIFTSAIPRGYLTVSGRNYEELKTAPNTVPDAGFKPIKPKYLPEGFVLSGGDVSVVKGVRNLHLIYSDGLRTMSLFENATGKAIDFGGMHVQSTHFEDHDAKYVRDGPTTLLAWREQGLSFALVGDLDLREMLRIATSVVP